MNTRTVAGLGIAVVAAAAGGWLWMDYSIRKAVDNYLQSAVDSGRYDALSYEDLHFNLRRDITLENFLVREDDLVYVFDEVQLRNLDLRNEFPHHVDLSIRGLRFPEGLPEADDDDSLQPWLERIAASGEPIPLQIDYSHSYDPDNAWQFNTQTRVDLPGMLRLDLNSRLNNLSIEALQQLEQQVQNNPEQAQALMLPVLGNTRVQSLEFELADSGLVQAMMEIGAGELQAQPEDYRTLLVSQARNAYLFMPANAQELARGIGEQLATFLEGNRTLQLRLNPQFEGHVERLTPEIMAAAFTGDIGRIAELLNLELQTR
jgi:hypothetical protein